MPLKDRPEPPSVEHIAEPNMGPDIQTHITSLNTEKGRAVIEFFKQRATKVVWDRVQGYTISEPDESRKWSDDYGVCIGCIIVGRDPRTGKNISMLMHVLPVLGSKQKDFDIEFAKKVGAFADMQLEDVRATIFGGSIPAIQSDDVQLMIEQGSRDKYISGITDLALRIEALTGVRATVDSGPWSHRTAPFQQRSPLIPPHENRG